MVTYKTDRPNSYYFFKQLLTTIVIVSLPILYDLLFPTPFIKDTYYWVAGALILMRIIDETSRDRLTEIRFDTDNKQVIFIYKTLLSAPRQKRLPLENARLEVAQSKSSWTWLWEPLTLYFLKNKKEVFEIKKSKDGFSVDKLREITKTVETLSLPITKV
jgi:hypothetical protein